MKTTTYANYKEASGAHANIFRKNLTAARESGDCLDNFCDKYVTKIGSVRISRINEDRLSSKFNRIEFTITDASWYNRTYDKIESGVYAEMIAQGNQNMFTHWDINEYGDCVDLVGHLTEDGRKWFAAQIRAWDDPKRGIDNMARLIAVAKGR